MPIVRARLMCPSCHRPRSSAITSHSSDSRLWARCPMRPRFAMVGRPPVFQSASARKHQVPSGLQIGHGRTPGSSRRDPAHAYPPQIPARFCLRGPRWPLLLLKPPGVGLNAPRAGTAGLRSRTAIPLRCTVEHLKARQDGHGHAKVDISAACRLCNVRRHKCKKRPAPMLT